MSGSHGTPKPNLIISPYLPVLQWGIIKRRVLMRDGKRRNRNRDAERVKAQ